MKSLVFGLLLLVTTLGIQYNYEDGLEFYHYANAVFCDDATILNWSCKYPCGNTTGMIDTRVIYNALDNIKGYAGY